MDPISHEVPRLPSFQPRLFFTLSKTGRLLVAVCLADLLRIYAPETPFPEGGPEMRVRIPAYQLDLLSFAST